MRCPYCNSTDSRVTDSRPDTEDAIIRRRRVCEQCGAKFTTVERIQMRDLMVRKNSGKLEAFDREKLRRSIKLACRNRDVGDEQIESNDFIHKATNWCGRDDINRTLSLINMKQTGRKIKLNKNITFHGTDSDMGHAYPWKFEIDEIHELV